MPIGSNLQEMENVVTKNASPGDPMPKLTTGGTPATYEDLGGPTPENYKVDDNSAKLNTPGKTLKQVKDVINKKAGKADPMPTLAGGAVKKEEAELPEDQVVSEEETTEEEVVAESEVETTETEEVVAEEETTEEEVVEEEESFSVEADVNALLEGEELSEDFKAKATTIFEAAIKSKIGEIKEELKGEYEKSLAEEVSAMKEVLEDRTDAYLEYIAQEWMEENALAVEHGLKTEMTESFLKGMKSLFEDHYVTIPEEKYDVINNMVDKLDEMENKLNEQINKNIALNKRLAESVSDVILADVSEGLALSQKDKLASLAKNVEFDSEETYREKLGTLRESYFPSASAPRDHSETISEGTEAPQAAPSGLMESYLQTMDRVSKK
tara:strand:- start:197 stop:1345 length:1149 start_codon:yes stop_codon:yes gene_type:complete